jgi:hypothetical protein
VRRATFLTSTKGRGGYEAVSDVGSGDGGLLWPWAKDAFLYFQSQ